MLKNLLLKLFIFRKALSTYKELCTLASDLKKPELVYKFLYLSNIQASKRRNTTKTRFNNEQVNN